MCYNPSPSLPPPPPYPFPLDIQLLHPSDPLVTLTFNQRTDSSSSSSSLPGAGVGAGAGGGGGGGNGPPRTPLHSSVDPVTLLPTFHMDISADDVFGPLDALASWTGASSRWCTRHDMTWHDTTNLMKWCICLYPCWLTILLLMNVIPAH